MDWKFYKRYHQFKARLAPFRKKTDFETKKTVGICDALVDRADLICNGNVPGGYVLNCPPGIDIENLMQRAENHLQALERGELPLKGKFAEPGISVSDHAIVEKDGKIHVFYNRGYVGYDWPERCCDTIGHAVSDDLINWEVLPLAITIEPDTYDNYSTWSPTIVLKNGKYYMIYTGVNENTCEAMCLATSDDLCVWKKYSKEPIYIPGDWCPWDRNKWSDCRDPYVFQDDDGIYYMFFCTMVKQEDGGQHNAMGIASSKDLIHWKDEKQFLLKGCSHMPESPFVIKRNGKYYLFYTNCGKGTCYAVADNVLGEYEVKELLIGGEKISEDLAHVPSCAEVFEFKGNWYITYATRLPGNEQYIELKEFFWNEDDSITIGKDVK